MHDDAKPKPLAADINAPFDRRALLGAAAASVACAAVGMPTVARAEILRRWSAKPPRGFVRMALPGKVVRVHRKNSLQSNGAYPKADAARAMLQRAMAALTGQTDIGKAFATLVHPDDKVAIKPNGIAGRKSMKMAANKELILEVVRGVMAAGVPAQNIMIYEQYKTFFYATRCIVNMQTLELAPEFPKGIKTAVHLNKAADMDSITVGGLPTKFVKPFTDATAVINVTQLKDHSICGYTGALKNITHGSTINPHHFHRHGASPQIAHLYAQDVVTSRMVLHIKDAYQVIYEGGPIDKYPKRRVPHEALYVATDPVALDVVGWKVVEKLRKDNALPTLKAVKREPSYIRVAGELGLGVFDDQRIQLERIEA